MERMYGIQAEKEHYACMVDLYGRSGHLEKAENLIRSMPLEPDVVVWGAMLGACGMHSSLGFALFAAEEMYKLEKDHPAMYSLLSKIHGDKGGWSRVIEMRKMMKQVGAKKQTASSWIES
ncbi:Pentatricopeptide repeat-containing protein [Thalictrum thalictroides]|nr:Pentatricopeptide repeat-containing protein [Thalictrum thalictroides]